MKNKRITALVSLLLMITGCSSLNSNQSTPLSSGGYAAILPFETSDMRVKHSGLFTSLDARIQMEEGLMELSKQHFNPSSVGFKNHVFLTYDELDASDGSRGLLGTTRDDNPNGLNPSFDEEFDTGNGKVAGVTILVDIYELDWYSNDTLKGISVGMVVNDEVVSADGKAVSITDEKLKNYVKVSSAKLVSYMRQRFNEIASDIPIYIAAFRLDSSDSAASIGGYFYDGYYVGSQGSFGNIDEQWVSFPSAKFTEMDEELSKQYDDYESKVSMVLADYSYITGTVKFEKQTPVQMNINVETHGKTAGEILAVTQSIRENLSIFTETSCNYIVRVSNNGTVYAMLQREAGSTDVKVITTIS